MDHLARGSMKNAAKCATNCELQDTWTLTFRTHIAPLWDSIPRAMSVWGSVIIKACNCVCQSSLHIVLIGFHFARFLTDICGAQHWLVIDKRLWHAHAGTQQSQWHVCAAAVVCLNVFQWSWSHVIVSNLLYIQCCLLRVCLHPCKLLHAGRWIHLSMLNDWQSNAWNKMSLHIWSSTVDDNRNIASSVCTKCV